MNFESVFPFQVFILPPQDFTAFLGWLIMAGVLGILLKRFWEPVHIRQKRSWLIYAVLAVLSVLFTIFGSIKLGASSAIPLPNLNNEAYSPRLLLFFMLPFQLAAGLLGVAPAFIIGLISGVCLAFLETHNIFTIIEISGMAMVFAFCVRQNYRSRFARFVRIPVVAASIAGVLLIPLYILNQLFSINGQLAVRIDFALSQSWQILSIRMIELLIAAFFSTILFLLKQKIWFKPQKLVPSPMERSIAQKFIFFAVPTLILVIFVLLINIWRVAGNAAEDMIESNMRGTAEITVESLPYFLEAGQNLLLTLSDVNLVREDDLQIILSEKIRSVPFYRQLYVFDADRNPIDGYPERDIEQLRLTNDEFNAIDLALKGVTLQTYTSPPWLEKETAQISFIASIKDENQVPVGVLLGRTDLNTNPFTQPAIEALDAAAEDGGQGIILDENNLILFHTKGSPDLLMTPYAGDIPEEASFYTAYSPLGAPELVYYQPMLGKPWAVVLTVPAHQSQELALEIATPLMILLFVLTGLVAIVIQFSLRSVMNTVKGLSHQAALIAQGNLDTVMPVTRVDEFGQLAYAFEQMRLRLKDRISELKSLLIASQGVAAHLEIEAAVKPLLESALPADGYIARLVLDKSVFSEQLNRPFVSIGIGEQDSRYEELDHQLFELAKNQTIVPVSNFNRFKRLSSPQGLTPPGSLLSVPLYYENEYFGVIWIGYKQPKNFTESDVQFLSTLAGQAALAAGNAKLYMNAELGRERFEAVLNSTPEPVMVFDEFDRLFLINPAAKHLTGLVRLATTGAFIDDIIENKDLLTLLKSPTMDRDTSRDIELSNNRVYYTTVSPVNTMDRLVGKVCILRDITHFKELDTLKSDIVATVSHDLRSPLTLMRGYATMLQMVGELNEQQKNYVGKIVTGVDNMSKLVNNLLDLGRIEAGIGLNIEPIYPGVIVEQVLTQLQPQANQKKININFHSSLPAALKIELDPALIQQAIYNLIENGIKYTAIGGNVDIYLRLKPDHQILFEVHDTGIGISPIDLPRLFDKFYRSGRREAYKERGTGLGLAIVKSITERHNGKVWVESKLGRGSVFYMSLPTIRT
ncbi:MAG: hypothetical protein CL609_12405 [Anaerolineaceae bacterium]|nr:hypothetical protein [Anaerolineaceae bacterium]